MKRFEKLLFALLLLPALASAKVPDDDDILDRTMNTASPFYFTKLMMRYNAGDTTMTDEDYHYLYYGYAFQEEYKPFASNQALDRMLMIAARIDVERPLREDLELLVSAGNDAQKVDPFSPKVLNLMAYAYGALGDTIRERAYYERMNRIIRTIEQSGDGYTQKTPQHILMFDHALDVLASEGLPYGRSRVISREVEFVPLVSPMVIEGKKRKGFYFDFSRIYRNKPEGYTYKRDRTWQFNNLKPRTYK